MTTEDDALIERALMLLGKVQFKGYTFSVRDAHGGVHLQGMYDDEDIYTKKIEKQHTRKWLLSPKMTNSEIVQTAFKLCITSFEHRCREAFTYRGKRIFGPHFDIEELVIICNDGGEEEGGRPPSDPLARH